MKYKVVEWFSEKEYASKFADSNLAFGYLKAIQEEYNNDLEHKWIKDGKPKEKKPPILYLAVVPEDYIWTSRGPSGHTWSPKVNSCA